MKNLQVEAERVSRFGAEDPPKKGRSPGGEQPVGGGTCEIRERDKSAAVAGELACLAGYMAGYLRATGSSCTPTGSPQYHPHAHPMGVSSHPHPHSHPHPGAPHHALPTTFALAAHGHAQPHPLEHTLPGYPQGESFRAKSHSQRDSSQSDRSYFATLCLMGRSIDARVQVAEVIVRWRQWQPRRARVY